MSTVRSLDSLSQVPWSLRLAQVRRSFGVTIPAMARCLRCSIDSLKRIEQRGRLLRLSELWAYALALRVSPERLIEEHQAGFFDRPESRRWLHALRVKVLSSFANSAYESLQIQAGELVRVIDQLEHVASADLHDAQIAGWALSGYHGPFHHSASVMKTENVSLRTVQRRSGLPPAELKSLLCPCADITVSELESLSRGLEIPARTLLRGEEFGSPELEIRSLLLKLGKHLRTFEETPEAAPHLRWLSATLVRLSEISEIAPCGLKALPKVGQRRTKDDIAPIEENMIQECPWMLVLSD